METEPENMETETQNWIVSVDRGTGTDWEITITSLDVIRHFDGWLHITDFEGDVHIFSNGGGLVLSIVREKEEPFTVVEDV